MSFMWTFLGAQYATADVIIFEVIVIGFSIYRNLSVLIFQKYQNVIKLDTFHLLIFKCDVLEVVVALLRNEIIPSFLSSSFH